MTNAADDVVEIEVVIDRSGSMGGYINDTIGSYNTWLAGQQALPGKAGLTLTMFNGTLETFPRTFLDGARKLDKQNYRPGGSTALNDAIGHAMNRLLQHDSDKAILVILTDGEENASKEFDTATIKKRIEAAQERGWQIVYLSADVNAFQHAAMYGVKRDNTVQVAASGEGMRSAMRSATTLNSEYRGGGLGAPVMGSAPITPQAAPDFLASFCVDNSSSSGADCGSDSSSSSSSDSGSCGGGGD